MNHTYQILFSDLDATLLNDQKQIEPGTKAAIEQMLSRGAFFAICTGRPLASARAVAKQFGLDQKGCYIAAYNGGVLYDPSKDKVLSYASIPLSVVREMFARAGRAGLYIHTYDRNDDTVLTYKDTPELSYYTNHTKLAPRIGTDVLKTLTQEPAKLIVADLLHHDRLVRFQKEQEEWSKGVLNSFFSCEQYLEYCPAGISKGAFYLFFESKEALFCEVICSVQEQICNAASALIEKYKDRYGVAEALKFIYREYDQNNFLCNSNSTDFTIFMNKLSEEQSKKIVESNKKSQQLFLNPSYLRCKVDADMAMSVIYSLILNIKNKDILPQDHVETFDFMVDHLIDSLYE